MTEEEIRRDLRLAKDPAAQVKVISELTLKPISYIADLYEKEFGKKLSVPAEKERLYHKWTEDEEELLQRRVREGVCNEDIAVDFGVSVGAVKSKIKNMKLKRTAPAKKSMKMAVCPVKDTVAEYVPSRRNRKAANPAPKRNKNTELFERAKQLLGEAGYIVLAIEKAPAEIILEVNEKTGRNEIHIELADGQILTLAGGAYKEQDVRI